MPVTGNAATRAPEETAGGARTIDASRPGYLRAVAAAGQRQAGRPEHHKIICGEIYSVCKTYATLGPMGAKTIGFAVADEDRPQLDELVDYFGSGNRSAYLRETLKIMNSVKLAEEWQQLQAYGQSRLDALGLTLDDVSALVRQELKGHA